MYKKFTMIFLATNPVNGSLLADSLAGESKPEEGVFCKHHLAKSF